MRARGLFAYYAELGRVVSADELSAVMPEGRDAIRSAIKELRDLGYIMVTKQQVKGQWRTYLKFSESALKLLSTDDGFSGALSIVHSSSTTTSTSTNTTSDNSIYKDTNVSLYISGDKLPRKEGAEMPWNLDGEDKSEAELKREAKTKAALEQIEATFGVGKIKNSSDKQAMRNAKYKKVEEDSSLNHRRNKPEADWNTNDLLSEFSMLFYQSSAKELTMQINARSLAIWINQRVGMGATRQQILNAIRMFFGDPRNLNEAGNGEPVWRRFIAFYQSVEGKAREEEVVVYADEEFLAHQEKMLKLLESRHVRSE
jgi:hypothetical protein